MAEGLWNNSAEEVEDGRRLGYAMSILWELEAGNYSFGGHWLNAEEESWVDYLATGMEICVERGYQEKYERMLWYVNDNNPDNLQPTWEEAIQEHQERQERLAAMMERWNNMEGT